MQGGGVSDLNVKAAGRHARSQGIRPGVHGGRAGEPLWRQGREASSIFHLGVRLLLQTSSSRLPGACTSCYAASYVSWVSVW